MSNDEENKQQDENNSEETRESRGGRDDGRRRGGGGGRGRGGGGGGGRGRRRGRDTYCPEGKCYDYKDVEGLRRHLTEVGKIKPRRQTRNCARCQRELAREVKRARHLALLPFVSGGE